MDKPVDKHIIPEILDFSELKPSNNMNPVEWIKANGKDGEIEIEVFIKKYDEATLQKLMRGADVFSPKPHLIKVLE